MGQVGEKGDKGATGDQGPKGDMGDKGLKGAQGMPGVFKSTDFHISCLEPNNDYCTVVETKKIALKDTDIGSYEKYIWTTDFVISTTTYKDIQFSVVKIGKKITITQLTNPTPSPITSISVSIISSSALPIQFRPLTDISSSGIITNENKYTAFQIKNSGKLYIFLSDNTPLASGTLFSWSPFSFTFSQ